MAIDYIDEAAEEHECPGCRRPLTAAHYRQDECAYVCPDCDTSFDPQEVVEEEDWDSARICYNFNCSGILNASHEDEDGDYICPECGEIYSDTEFLELAKYKSNG